VGGGIFFIAFKRELRTFKKGKYQAQDPFQCNAIAVHFSFKVGTTYNIPGYRVDKCMITLPHSTLSS
jgi:hypothetical protein